MSVNLKKELVAPDESLSESCEVKKMMEEKELWGTRGEGEIGDWGCNPT